MAIENIGVESPKFLLNEQSKSFLSETAKWTNFLSILGFVGIGLMVLLGLFFGSFIAAVSEFPGASGGGAFFTIIYLLIAALYFFPVLYLYKFSSNMKKALVMEDEGALSESFKNLKSHYKFIGILTIIILAFYILMFLFGIIAGASASL